MRDWRWGEYDREGRTAVERTDYIYDSDTECERLEKQAILEGIERYLRFLPVPEGGRVLDAGCRSGSITRLLASRNPKAHIVGVDFNPRFIAYASVVHGSEMRTQ
jgi:2-polyprenyl-3-methyl-5-hydroxy-6-metoxy-1,4-benzoquinol methylase